METRSLRQRKKQKKSKSGSDNGNANVLVVPPDILKKLGISIDNSSSVYEGTDSTQNKVIATVPASNNNIKSNEASCLETASLMMKSVLLSPSFNPELASLDFGEVEMSNVNSSNGSESTTERLPSENYNGICFKNKQDVSEKKIIECQVPVKLCNNNIKEPQMLSIDDAKKLVNGNIQNGKCTDQRDRVQSVDELCILNSDEHEKTLSAMNLQDQLVHLVQNNLIPVRILDSQLEESPLKNGSIDNDDIKNFNELNNKGIAPNTFDINNVNNIEVELYENTSSLRPEIQLNQTEPEYNSTCSKSNEYAIEKGINLTTEVKVIQPVQDEIKNSFSSIPENSIQIKEVECNIKSLDRFQMELREVEKDILGLESKKNDMLQSNSDIVFINGTEHSKEFADLDVDVISIPLLLNENNLIPLDESVNQMIMEEVRAAFDANNVPMEDAGDVNDVNENESGIETYSTVITNGQSDETLSHIITSFGNSDGYTSQNVKEENEIPIEINDIEGISNNNVKDCSQTESLCNGEHPVIPHESYDINCVRSDLDNVIPKKKIKQKINIICAETIPSSDLKEFRKMHTPIIKSLTPVPLNSIIAPKRHNGFARDIIIKKELMTSEVKIEDDPSGILTQKKCLLELNKNILTLNNLESDLSKFENRGKIDGIKNSHNSVTDDLCASKSGEFEYREEVYTNNSSSITDEEQSLPKRNDIILSVGTRDIISTEKFEFGIEHMKDIECLQNSSDKLNNNNESPHITHSTTEDKEVYYNQLNEIIKSNIVNSDTNTHQDKVKELACYIKKHAHLYKVNKTEIKKDCNNIETYKNNTTSKLCIQGVEKPGGHIDKIEASGKAMVLKTYSRQKKGTKSSTKMKNTAITAISNIEYGTETELNNVNISMSCKSQDFCLCYDFGRLDASDYDNSYEHVHFGLRQDNNDLESILSIYNDEEPSFIDRSKLDNAPILELTEDNAKTSTICWNYFTTRQNDTSNQLQVVNDCINESNNVIMTEAQSQEKEAITTTGAQPHVADNTCTNKTEAVKFDSIESSIKTLAPVNDGNNDSKVVSMAEAAFIQNPHENMELAVCDTMPIMSSEDKISQKDETPQQTLPKDSKGSPSAKVITMVQEQEDSHDINKEIVKEPTSTCKSLPEKEKASFVIKQEKGERSNRKRSRQSGSTSEEPSSKKKVKCGVCNKLLPEVEWDSHIEKQHGYIAWKFGQSFDFEDPNLIKKLQLKWESSGSLNCSNCYFKAKKISNFIAHVKTCTKQESHSRRSSSFKNLVICGVCQKEVEYSSWNQHIGKEHKYLAWIEGLDVLNVEDEGVVLRHLQNIIECHGSLECYKCGFSRKRPKVYLAHMEICNGKDGKKTTKDDSLASVQVNSPAIQTATDKKTITCGVCKKEILIVQWTEHIGKEHNYLAWEEGSPPVDWNDEKAVWNHLQEFVRNHGGLLCYKCGLNRKRVKLYLSHIEECNGELPSLDESALESSLNQSTSNDVQCGVCKTKVAVSNWDEHMAREHNYLAWRVGDTPLDINDENAVKDHLQDIITTSKVLICYKCGVNRKRVRLYLSHIKTCDGSQSTLDQSTTSDLNCTASSEQIEISIEQTSTVKCGVCKQDMSPGMWLEHSGREHKYIAWRQGEEPLDPENAEAIKLHLLTIATENNGLKCYACQITKKYPKVYQQHVKKCRGSSSTLDQSTTSDLNCTASSEQIEISIEQTSTVKCGVCQQDVSPGMWLEHSGREHKYIAWRQGEEPLDPENAAAVKAHLFSVSRENKGLICYICRITMKYPKPFLQHVKTCGGSSLDDSSEFHIETERYFDMSDIKADTVVCGVCSKVVMKSDWFTHMEVVHDYMAWLQGRPELDLKDFSVVQKHLIYISRKVKGLKCKHCNRVMKYAKPYLEHIDACGKGTWQKNAVVMKGKDSVECGVCSATVEPKDWIAHAMKKHYNVAWVKGAPPIEINSPYTVEPYIKQYQAKHGNKLVCRTCGINRVSAVGFYAHIITCGKTDEEMDIYKDLCTICNNKYLRIYKSQHMTMHKEKDLAEQRKLLAAKEKELVREEVEPVEIVGGKRKAAEKAITVIEKYASNTADGHCQKCGFTSDVASEMASHVCVEREEDNSESDESMKMDHFSGDDDDDTDIDSNISDEEHQARYGEMTKSKRHGERPQIQRLPYKVKNVNTYMRRSAEELASLHMTDEVLFTQYHNFNYEIVAECEMDNYMPPVAESCNVRYHKNEDWVTYKRFEAARKKEIITMFTGSCIYSMSWLPRYAGEHKMGVTDEYLTVLTSPSMDRPRHSWDDNPAPSPALIQIWNCGNVMTRIPELAMGLAFDCGTIWAFDWCPSGARDIINREKECTETRRLGLLAVASASGSAFVFVVPEPSTIKEKEHLFFKLKPVAELRLVMDSSRKVYQATAIKWSPQKGHAHIVVGYSDGTTAFYDLENDSPLLKCRENGVDIIYPYHDERAQGVCIEDVDVFPTMRGRDAGVTVSCSVGGAGTRLLQAHFAATRVMFPPHWPAALLSGDDNLVRQAVNELEWFGGGRRVGGMRAVCGCNWCGRLVAASPPLIRLMRPHPSFSDINKQVVATLQMVSLGSKRKRKNDELTMIMEPLTYSDAVTKYGLELQRVTSRDRNTQQKLTALPRESYPERFPLADVPAMAFCPTYRNHTKLAIATHAGLIFILSV